MRGFHHPLVVHVVVIMPSGAGRLERIKARCGESTTVDLYLPDIDRTMSLTCPQDLCPHNTWQNGHGSGYWKLGFFLEGEVRQSKSRNTAPAGHTQWSPFLVKRDSFNVDKA